MHSHDLEAYISTDDELYVKEKNVYKKIQLPIRPDHKYHNTCVAIGRNHAFFYVTHRANTDTVHNFYLKLRRCVVQGYFKDVEITANDLSLN
jgi:hypothetical protein